MKDESIENVPKNLGNPSSRVRFIERGGFALAPMSYREEIITEIFEREIESKSLRLFELGFFFFLLKKIVSLSCYLFQLLREF